jgi:type II secretory pathway component PulM
MRALPSLSDSFQRLKPRERRMVIGGAVVSVVTLLLAGVVLPFADHWSARETAYAASRDQWVRLSTLAASTDRLKRALDLERVAVAGDEDRLVTGDTPALAASALQGLLQGYAQQSAVQLQRVDVAGEPKADKPGLLAIPVDLSGTSSVAGLVDFLSRLERGQTLLVLDEVAVNAGIDTPEASISDVGGGQSKTLTWTLHLHGLYAAEPAAGAGGGS